MSYFAGWAIALTSEGAARPLNRQFTNWPWDGILGVGESGIGSQQNVENCNVFSSYATAFEKPGLIQKFDIYQKKTEQTAMPIGVNLTSNPVTDCWQDY